MQITWMMLIKQLKKWRKEKKEENQANNLFRTEDKINLYNKKDKLRYRFIVYLTGFKN
jgi:hypothetical protein